MTKQITRYSIGVTLDEDLSIDADENGEWVKYDDVKRLLQHEMTVEEVMRATREPSQEDWAAAKAAVEPREDPLAGVRWICRNCGTSNGIDDVSCLGCRKPREEQDRRVENRRAEP